MRNHWLTIIIALTTVFVLVFLTFNANKHPQSMIWSDTEGYYVYLPSIFIYGDFTKKAVRDTNYIRPWPGTEKIFTKYSCGVAILEAPFFVIAHLLSKPLGYPLDGHSLIYCYSLMFSGIFYMLAGMYLLWRSIIPYYGNQVALLSLFGLFWGTNMYYYTIFQPGMSHIYSFFLFSALIYLTERLLQPKTRLSDFILFGFVSGLLVLVRPTSVIVLLYPLYRWIKQNGDKRAFLQKNVVGIVCMLAAAILIWLPQIFYWKAITGQWFLWSYGTETFIYWKEPKLFRVLFDAWNGWLLYSPIAIIPLIGLFIGRHTNRHSERIIMVIFAIATYLFASWWAWWFGGAFGHRCYVEYYAFLALPFAAVGDRVFKYPLRKWAFIGLCMLLIYYNLGLTYRYNAPWDGPDWTYARVWEVITTLF